MNGWVIGILVYLGVCLVTIAVILIHLKRCESKHNDRFIRFADEPEDLRRAMLRLRSVRDAGTELTEQEAAGERTL